MIISRISLPTPPFPAFLDVDPRELAGEEAMRRLPRDFLASAWTDYLRRILPPEQQKTAN
jgi:hypothetical protein